MSALFSHSSGASGQGTTEYIILLGIVLTLGLAVMGILNFFPAFSFNSQSGDSAQYWQDSASPIAIVDWLQAGSDLQFVVENRASSDLTLTQVVMEAEANNYTLSPSLALAPGERSTVAIPTESCTGHKVLSYNVYFTYSTEQVPDLTQVGIKPLFTQCSD